MSNPSWSSLSLGPSRVNLCQCDHSDRASTQTWRIREFHFFRLPFLRWLWINPQFQTYQCVFDSSLLSLAVYSPSSLTCPTPLMPKTRTTSTVSRIPTFWIDSFAYRASILTELKQNGRLTSLSGVPLHSHLLISPFDSHAQLHFLRLRAILNVCTFS